MGAAIFDLSMMLCRSGTSWIVSSFLLVCLPWILTGNQPQRVTATQIASAVSVFQSHELYRDISDKVHPHVHCADLRNHDDDKLNQLSFASSCSSGWPIYTHIWTWKFVFCRLYYGQTRISRIPIMKHTKRGLTVLFMTNCDPWVDITICMDVSTNPGPCAHTDRDPIVYVNNQCRLLKNYFDYYYYY